MKTTAIFLIIVCNIFAIRPKPASKPGFIVNNIPCVSLAEAQKVLGEPAVLLNNTTGEKAGIKENNCAYAAKAADPDKHVTGSFYINVKQYPTAAAAHTAYADMYTANSHMQGQEKVSIGDEGYYHTDGEHFHFFVFRSGREMAVMKVNKITGKTSLPEMRKLAEKMAGKTSML